MVIPVPSGVQQAIGDVASSAGDDGLAIGDIVSGAIDIAGSFLGSQGQASDNTAASAAYADAVANSADILNRGYDAQLGYIQEGSDALRGISDAGLVDITNVLEDTDSEYADALRAAYGSYGNYMLPQLDQYGNQMQGATGQFVDDIFGTAQSTAGILQDGSGEYAETLSPYSDQGIKALQYLSSVMGADPSQLDPAQRRLWEDRKRDALATLAASGLRGAGRGGVAAVNEGMAELDAQMFQQNRDRADRAAYELNRTGYGANRSVADNSMRLADSVADLTYRTGQQAGQQRFNTASDIAKTGFRLGQDVGNKQFDSESNIARHGSQTGGQKANTVSNYYGNVAGIEGGRFQSMADTELAKASADASAAGVIGQTRYNTDTANSAITNRGIGEVTTVLSKAAKDALKNKTINI